MTRPHRITFVLSGFAFVSSAMLGLACLTTAQADGNEPVPVGLAAHAKALAVNSIIVDTHIDAPTKLFENPGSNFGNSTPEFNFDYPRAVKGGLDAPFMSIYVPAELEAEGGSFKRAETLIDLVNSMVSKSPDKFALARSPADVRANKAKHLISLPMGMENGSPIEDDLKNVQRFYDQGIRYITLAHSLSNHIADSSYDANKHWHGLSPFGEKVVHEMNRVGIMVDVSHISDEAFWDVLKITDVPVIASHSSCRFFVPGFERDMSDDMIKALAKNGGVIQINFASSFLKKSAFDYAEARNKALKIYQEAHPDTTPEQVRARFIPAYEKQHGPIPYVSTDDVLDHIEHVIKLVGIDYVGIGSDFDGVGDLLPAGLKDVSTYPNIIAGLIERGYSDDDIRKVLGENLLRVWQVVDDHARSR